MGQHPWISAGIAAPIRMKTNDTQSQKTTWDIYPTDNVVSGAADGCVAASLESPVWRYFAAEIIEAVIEVQEALTAEQKG
jgi:hypothetical protein